MEKRIILEELKEFISCKQIGEIDKKTAKFLEILKAVTEEDMFLGEKPTYFFATVTCNSTAVGRSTFKGTESQKTVARDYITDEYLFVDGHSITAKKGAELFLLKEGETINYYKKEDIVKVAKDFGFRLHARDFRDLNFTIYNHRLNRHTVNITKGPFTYPIVPVFASTEVCPDKFVIGYVYEKDGIEYIIIEPEMPKSVSKKSKNTFGCAPWMFLGLICPPILAVAAFVMLVKFQKERLRG